MKDTGDAASQCARSGDDGRGGVKRGGNDATRGRRRSGAFGAGGVEGWGVGGEAHGGTAPSSAWGGRTAGGGGERFELREALLRVQVAHEDQGPVAAMGAAKASLAARSSGLGVAAAVE